MANPDPAPFSSSTAWTVIRAILIIATAIIWYEAGAERGTQMAGLALLVQSAVFVKQRSVPYGWRGAPPSGFITGVSAIFWSVVLAVLGVVMLIKPDLFAPLFAVLAASPTAGH